MLYVWRTEEKTRSGEPVQATFHAMQANDMLVFELWIQLVHASNIRFDTNKPKLGTLEVFTMDNVDQISGWKIGQDAAGRFSYDVFSCYSNHHDKRA